MSSIYLSALVFGGILILFSIVLGGDSDKSIEADKDLSLDKDFDFGDVDVDADVDADADADGDASHGDVDSTWLPFSEFWTFDCIWDNKYIGSRPSSGITTHIYCHGCWHRLDHRLCISQIEKKK